MHTIKRINTIFCQIASPSNNESDQLAHYADRSVSLFGAHQDIRCLQIVNNESNFDNKSASKRSNFWDDCGVWETSSGSSPTSYYQIVGNSNLRKIYLKQKVFCIEKQINRKRQYIPMEPQPDPKTVVSLQRYYAKLKLDKNYEKRVTYFGKGSSNKFALVEYIGKFPGLAAHGNAKSGENEYVRTPAAVMTEMGEMLKSDKPTAVYNTLKRKHDDMARPKNIGQVRHKKIREK